MSKTLPRVGSPSTMELGIIDLLKVFGFDERLKTKLVRHKDSSFDMADLIRDGWFELYQALQRRPIFRGCQQIVSFIGDGSRRARLFGVYNVLKEGRFSKALVPANCPHKRWRVTSKYHYHLERRREFANVEGRVIIDWGSGALAWHQHLTNKPVVEMFPKGRVLGPFKDYLDFTLTFTQLKELVTKAHAHRDWMASLSAVAGVYMVLDQNSGHQYVGSAYGLGGIWGRWSQYAADGCGGNAKLRALLNSDKAYPKAFRFSVLQVLPKTTTAQEVIRWESLYKVKLGSRATGLNLN